MYGRQDRPGQLLLSTAAASGVRKAATKLSVCPEKMSRLLMREWRLFKSPKVDILVTSYSYIHCHRQFHENNTEYARMVQNSNVFESRMV